MIGMKIRAFIFVLAVALAGAGTAHAGHEGDRGWIHTGVGSESEARSYPCPTTAAGGWERTGPVVCLQKKAPTWDLEYTPAGSGCTYSQTGWSGSCIFDIDMGDHVKVWGTRGIPYTEFRILWLHDGQTPAPDTDPRQGGGSGSGGFSGPEAPAQPAAPPGPGAPPAPGRPSSDVDVQGSPASPAGPDVPGSPDHPISSEVTADEDAVDEQSDPLASAAESDRTPSSVWRVLATLTALAAAGGAIYAIRRRSAA